MYIIRVFNLFRLVLLELGLVLLELGLVLLELRLVLLELGPCIVIKR